MSIILLDNPGTEYTTANYRALIALLGPVLQGRGRSLDELGRRLGALIKPNSPRLPFANVGALADHLINTFDAGRTAQTLGDDLEARAAQQMGGDIAKGDTIPAWAINFVKNNGNDRDPDLYAGPGLTGATVKPDVWSDTAVGIVGGAAKANDVPNFISKCTQLVVVCQAHHKTPLVFCAANTPQDVLDAANLYVSGGVRAI